MSPTRAVSLKTMITPSTCRVCLRCQKEKRMKEKRMKKKHVNDRHAGDRYAGRSKVQEFLIDVSERTEASGHEAYERLRDAFVERELAKRVSLLNKGIQEWFQLFIKLCKVDRFDNEEFIVGGGASPWPTCSKARRKKIKRVKRALARHESALEDALTRNDFNGLKEIYE